MLILHGTIMYPLLKPPPSTSLSVSSSYMSMAQPASPPPGSAPGTGTGPGSGGTAPTVPGYVLVQTAKIRISSIEGVQRVGANTIVYLVGGGTLTLPAQDYYSLIKAMS